MAIELKPEDLVINTYRAPRTAGFINHGEVGVRLTHIPTRAEVKCDKDRSVHKNKADAMIMLTAKVQALFDEHQARHEAQGKLDIGNDRHGLPKLNVTPVMPLMKPPKDTNKSMKVFLKNKFNEAYCNYSGEARVDRTTSMCFDFEAGWKAAIKAMIEYEKT